MPGATHVTTFYSFKGGVGRTLLLANVGAGLAMRGRKVLLWDLDVEAPGMHNIPMLAPKPAATKGFLEWLLSWQTKYRAAPPKENLLAGLMKSIRQVPEIPNLHILPAHGANADFAGLYQDIDWTEFLAKDPAAGLNLFRKIISRLETQGKFDHILLDSRTGITDLGGFMAAVLPHATVLIGSYGSQNSSGLLAVYKALDGAATGKIQERQNLPNLKRLVVVSPVPMDQTDLRHSRKLLWDKAFPLGQDETRVEIPFDSRLLFSEDLLILSDRESRAARAYSKLTDVIEGFRNSLQDAVAVAETAEEIYPEANPSALNACRIQENRSFEDKIAILLSLLDYRVERRQLVDDNRVDLIAKKQGGIRSECYLVQCKENQIPASKAMLETFENWLNGPEARAMDAVGLVVASAFSPAALTHAKARGIEVRTPEDLEDDLFDFGPYLSKLKRTFEESILARSYVAQRVRPENKPEESEGADLLDRARDWAGGQGKKLWLLLGDCGAGKTAFFHRFAYELAKSATEDKTAPAPLAVNLKEFPTAATLESLLQEHLRTSADWHGNPAIILHLLETGRIVLLLDAFDEMGSPAAIRNIEEQFRQMARPTARNGNCDNPRGNRILITSRTHFFKDQSPIKKDAAKGADGKESRDSRLGQVARRFDAAMDELLPLGRGEIKKFLQNRLAASEAKKTEKLLSKTLGLKTLASRPILLEMIIKTLPSPTQTGGQATPTELYLRYTNLWIEDRFRGNIQTTPPQRKILLEMLSRELWTAPKQKIHHKRLTSALENRPSDHIAGLDLARVDIELRTADFIARTNDGYYSFSHRSFLEFFFAKHLLKTLRENQKSPEHVLSAINQTQECAQFLLALMKPDENNLKEEIKFILRTIFQAPAS